jgi:hypothetical protein
MNFWYSYLIVAAGVVISVVLPILRQFYPKPPQAAEARDTAKAYVYLGIGSLLTALLIVALAGDSLSSWKAALLTGYAWDSTLQKIAKPA